MPTSHGLFVTMGFQSLGNLDILYVLDKAWAADLYLIYKREPQASGCKSDTDRMRMLYRTCETSGWKCSYSSIISQKLMIFPEKIELEAYVNQDKICILFTDID
jgi:hypothetical protein